ncbi:MAG: ABC transporter, permease protein [Candidatus Methanoperedens nitroreducens]|uniref:ABC transporter, permease protein n=1 Tax=Candidatus Methanoperedens nitratireducens TaxID=1392998 RepID=A0A0P8ADJ6_9EURY|nr:FtsX-like permease family protein [Candidatus Methanoperedens sp. BLZ2]KAB2947569.1 MAG: ABC transporter permease [Candidatus Methanoperedens sp.]KPQ44929.1 MAG: ABC transporter, permease protein [Candidatus Methanoperedens sp. BLZ1]MBZ0177582.1 ABC transporter permease [Candidatus Methanoperedens nitroreducens]CAG0952646.1 ABC transporter permease YtrF [Methanosarcinales archaeon]MCX9078066.1 ABC transporter permease [Candidatus Methanoperedens sp.]
MSVDLRSAFFYSRKDIFKNIKIFIIITLSIILATANIIVINGLIDGMIEDLVDNTVESSVGHLNIYPDNNERFIEGIGIKEQRLATLKEVEAYSPRISATGVLSNKELSVSSTILALDPDKERKTTKLLEKLVRGAAVNPNDKNAILVSSRLAEDLKLDVGDEATLAFENGIIKVYNVKGIIRTGNLDFDSSTVIMPMDEAYRQLAIDNMASIILVKLSDKSMSEIYKPMIMQNLDVNNIRTWEEETEFVSNFANSWRSISSIISGVGLIAAAISVGIVIYINIIHKKRQIGIMKAIGTSNAFIFTVFLMEAAIFGVIGVFIGDSVGYLAIKYFEANPFLDAISQTWISARFEPQLFYIATIFSFGVTILAGVYPAIKASRVEIIKAIWGT